MERMRRAEKEGGGTQGVIYRCRRVSYAECTPTVAPVLISRLHHASCHDDKDGLTLPLTGTLLPSAVVPPPPSALSREACASSDP